MRLFIRNISMALATVLILGPALARADGGYDAGMRFGPPTNWPLPAVVLVDIQIWNGEGMGWGTIPVPPIIIPPGIPPAVKRFLVEAALQSVTDPRIGAVTDDGANGLSVHLDTLRPIRVRFNPGATGENPDYVLSTACAQGTISYAGFLDPLDYQGQPAIFTAGIVTDVGELSVQVSSQELNFQTQGPIICQALFQRLAPHAPQYGAQINYADDRLEVYFDPAYTLQPSGVIFGTTSKGQGAGGGVDTRSYLVRGDLNCDSIVDFDDINPFVMAVSDPGAYQQAYPDCDYLNGDCNGDGYVDFDDINPFIVILSGGG